MTEQKVKLEGRCDCNPLNHITESYKTIRNIDGVLISFYELHICCLWLGNNFYSARTLSNPTGHLSSPGCQFDS